MLNINPITFKLILFISVFLTLFLLAISAASWALFYDAETERLSSEKAKNMRIASICVVVFSIIMLAFIGIWMLSEFRNFPIKN